jgi:DNA-binding MurR/RpiR family transcriptional regulator
MLHFCLSFTIEGNRVNIRHLKNSEAFKGFNMDKVKMNSGKTKIKKRAENDAQSPEIAFSKSAIGQLLLRVLNEGSTSNRLVADYFLRNPMRVTVLSVAELAESCQLSTATISRFARDLGFESYSAMRAAVAETIQAVMLPVEKLRSTIEQRKGAASPISQSLEYAAANIITTNQNLSLQAVSGVVQKVTNARTVYVMGFGLSSHLAGLLTLHLQPFCRQVIEVCGYGGNEIAAGHLANVDERDVLIVISFPRYTIDGIRLTQFAKKHKASIVAITDSPASPLAELADHALIAKSDQSVLPSSGIAALAVIEALAIALMVSDKANVEKAEKLTEAISVFLYDGKPVSGANKDSTGKVKKNGK